MTTELPTVHPRDYQAAIVQALRSGDYTQIRGQYAKPDKKGRKCRCAVGVMIDICLGDEGWATKHDNGRTTIYLANGLETLHTVRAMTGLITGTISSDNDMAKLSFDEIATRIEEGRYANNYMQD